MEEIKFNINWTEKSLTLLSKVSYKQLKDIIHEILGDKEDEWSISCSISSEHIPINLDQGTYLGNMPITYTGSAADLYDNRITTSNNTKI